jgi:hypothetical protein
VLEDDEADLKPQLARVMLERALAAGTSAS